MYTFVEKSEYVGNTRLKKGQKLGSSQETQAGYTSTVGFENWLYDKPFYSTGSRLIIQDSSLCAHCSKVEFVKSIIALSFLSAFKIFKEHSRNI